MTTLNVSKKMIPYKSTVSMSTSTRKTSTAGSMKKKVVLIMNTKLDINVPMITDLGGVAVHANFTYGVKTEVYESCLVVFNGIAYIFGGSNQRRQVSRVENCQLTNVASLNFEFKSGACASTTDTIYLCFRSENWKSCRKGSDPSSGFFVSMAESNFTHKYIRIAASPGEAQSYYYDMILVDKVFRELLFK